MEDRTGSMESGDYQPDESGWKMDAEGNAEVNLQSAPATVEQAEEVPADSTEPLDTDELWPGGPNFAQVKAWKNEYGDDSVYVTSVSPTRHYVWRTMTRFEYRRLVKNLEQSISTGQVTQVEANMNNEESIAELCVLYPPVNRAQLAGHLAGVASIISQEVMDASGFAAMEVRQL